MGAALRRLPGPGLALVLLLAATALAYLPALRNGFVFDDTPYLIENPIFSGGPGLPAVAASFTRFHAGNWHPFTWLSHLLDLAVFGREPAGHHAVSVALHLATVALLWRLLRRMTGAPWASLFAAGLFALHPLNVESVAWVAERKNLLSTLFGILALDAWLSFARRPSPWPYSAALLAFTASLLSKSMLVTLPALLVLLDYWPLGRLRETGLRRAVVSKWPFFAISFAFGVVAILSQRAVAAIGELTQYPLWTRLANAVLSLGRYLWFIVRPTGLAAFYPHPVRDVPWTGLVIAATVVGGVTFAAVAWRRRRPWLLAGWLFYLVTLAPVIGVVQVGNQSMADRYAYVPLIGIFLAVAMALASLPRAFRWPVSGGALAALAALGLLTHRQVPVWKDAQSLFGHAIEVTEGNYLAHYNYGVALELDGRIFEAMDHYRETVRIEPDYHSAWTNLGTALCRQGRFGEAVPAYREVTRLQPGLADAWFNLASAVSDAGSPKDAVPLFEKGLAIRPRSAAALRNLGVTWFRLAMFENAARCLEESAALATSAATENDLGFALENLGRRKEAEARYRRSIELDPSPGNIARRNLARLGGR